MPGKFAFMGKFFISYAGLRVLVIFSVLGSEQMIPDTEYGAEVFFLDVLSRANDVSDATAASP
jgi:hypothetical protein